MSNYDFQDLNRIDNIELLDLRINSHNNICSGRSAQILETMDGRKVTVLTFPLDEVTAEELKYYKERGGDVEISQHNNLVFILEWTNGNYDNVNHKKLIRFLKHLDN